MIKDMKNIKKQVSEDWQNAFPQLVKYAQNKYYKILGSIIVGIELIKLPRVEEYRPHFVIYSLWGNKSGKDLKACFSGPILLMEFFNRKGLQFSIPYNKHSSEFPELIKAVKKQLPFSLEGDVPLKKVFSALDEYSKTPPLSASPNSYLQAVLMEFKLELAICSGSEKQVQDVFRQIKKRDWNLDHFELCGVNYKEWLKNIENKIAHKEELLSQIETNKKDKKLEKLMRSEFI